jgi:hypothetical protein
MNSSAADIRQPLSRANWPEASNIYSYIGLVLLLGVIIYSPWRGQKYGPAPIAGLRKGESVKAARQRFRTDAQRMLLDGYAQVCTF